MLNSDDNELLTRVGPGTPMGDMLREYWVPACRSAKLEADGAPERVRLFGENFVAFRATDGRVGFIAEGCPHRCASMALARNEGNGLRCIFHGWKVSVDGVCVDAPTEPPERREEFAKRVPVRHHPVREAGGLVWVYLGKQAEPPAFYDFEFNALPEAQVRPRRAILKCNWLQALEAALNSTHIGIMHSSATQKPDEYPSADEVSHRPAPIFEFIAKPYGFREGALRDLRNGTCYARIREVVLPFFSFIPPVDQVSHTVTIAVPIDDETTAQWYVVFNPFKPLENEYLGGEGRTSGDPDNFASNLGDASNLWHQDRDLMKRGHWTGMRSIPFEDFAVQESMGSIVDRRGEFLGICDAVIVRARNHLVKAVREHEQGGPVPFIDEAGYGRIRATSVYFPMGFDWRQVDPLDPKLPQPA